MTRNTGILFCTVVCWAISALVGGLAGSALVIIMGWSLLQATFAGCLVLVGCGVITAWSICGEQRTNNPVRRPSSPITANNTFHDSIDDAVQSTELSPEPESQINVRIKSSQLPGTEELARQKGEWRYQP
ncbi:MAG: hypothetical protein OXC62_17320 [Aestuariivita sp.]|nr:hypothetical protein [Aestuariivita sp.]